jgi:MscS family membrane protein
MEQTALRAMAQGNVWIVEILVGVIVLAVGSWGLKRIIKFLSRRYSERSYDWKSKLNYIFYTPLRLLITLMGCGYVIDILGHRFGFAAALDYLSPFRSASIVGCGAWMLLRLKNQLQHTFVAKSQMRKKAIDPVASNVLGRLSSIMIGIVSVLIVLQVLGLNIGPLLAFGGVGAAAVGFAAKDVISNFFGGLMLHITRPFSIGDTIDIKGNDLMGVIEDIGWYQTMIRDREKRPVYVPNALFSSVLVTNLTRCSHRKFEETFAVAFADSELVEEVVKEIKAMVSEDPEVDAQQMLLVSLDRIREYALEIHVLFYLLETQIQAFTDLKQKFLIQIRTLIESKGLKLSFPTTSIALEQVTLDALSNQPTSH